MPNPRNKKWMEYQGLGDVKGRRNTKPRIKELGILDYITAESDILDIGCNRGLFCVALAPHTHSTTGIEPVSENVDCGRKEITTKKLTNCELIKGPFAAGLFKNGQFDIVLSLAVHGYLDISMKEYASEINRILKPNGVLILEGHQKAWQMDQGRKTWPALVKDLDTRFERIKKYVIKDRPSGTDKHDRVVMHWRKK